MNLQEIVNRDNSYPITQDECLFVIKEYVKIRKNVDIIPALNLFNLRNEIELMTKLANNAIHWLRTNKY